ncbi:hypothetical protein [Alkalicoccus luteus]|uniref:Uncharacterized protein n=1 Tax=Alkalicoccus luteus TaxID=1237094 RepID=A0A969PTY0_9BACI|nr:hypothetical protein [Alkalicoccus luteus]NJP37848.1 hypothetical protein [Alkalicoccus luteus]
MEAAVIFSMGLLLMLAINFLGRRFIPGVNQSADQLIIISILQAAAIVLIILFLF